MTETRPSASQGARPRLHALDLLRGLCALGVAAYHFSLWGEVALWPPLAGTLAIFGTYGVSVFFILSGYSLAHAYERHFRESLSAGQVLQYFRRRLGRLGPLFAIVVLLSIAGKVLVTGKPIDPYATVANMALFFGLVNPASTPVVGGWSIGIEVVFYVLFPTLLLLRKTMPLVALLSIFATAWLSRDLSLFPSLAEGWGVYVHPANHFVFFAMGVFMRLADHRTPTVKPLVFVAILSAAVAAMVLFAANTSELQLVTGWRRALLVAISIGLVGLSGKLEVTGRAVGVCSLFAGLSYPLYLIHPLIYFGAKSRVSASPWLLLGLLFFAAVMAVLIDRWVDDPIQRRLKRVGW